MIAALAVALLATAAPDSGYIRGVHYFGDAWPLNFWDSFSASIAGLDAHP